MDARAETVKHIEAVRVLLNECALDLVRRGEAHDDSKLNTPEAEAFERETPILAGLEYGSQDYRDSLARLGPALQHHYASNAHHPENHEYGIAGMSLLDLLEMVCDWMSAAKRHATGDVLRSIEINQGRFGYDNVLKAIFQNTVSAIEELQGRGTEVIQQSPRVTPPLKFSRDCFAMIYPPAGEGPTTATK